MLSLSFQLPENWVRRSKRVGSDDVVVLIRDKNGVGASFKILLTPM